MGELRTLLGCLFPDAIAKGERAVGIERLTDNYVVPLSSAAKFPSIMTGDWHLLTHAPRELAVECMIIGRFVDELARYALISPGEYEQLYAWIVDGSEQVLAPYHSYKGHRDIKLLRDAYIRESRSVVKGRREMADIDGAGSPTEPTSVQSIMERVMSFVYVMEQSQVIQPAQAAVLYELVEARSSDILSAYESAALEKNSSRLAVLLVRIANQSLASAANRVHDGGIVKRMKVLNLLSQFTELSEAELIALRAVAADASGELGAKLDAAMETYDASRDVDDFLDSLHRIAGIAWAESGEDGGSARARDASQKVNVHAYLSAGVKLGAIREEDAAALAPLLDPTDPTVAAACQSFELTRDAEDFADTLYRIARAKTAADSVDGYDSLPDENAVGRCLATLEQLGYEGKVSLKESKVLARLVTRDGSSQQELILAGFELYEQDSNVSDFVDTCKRVLSNELLRLGSTHGVQSSKSTRQIESSGDGEEEEEEEEEEEDVTDSSDVETPEDIARYSMSEIVDALAEVQRLEDNENEVLQKLIDKGDPRLMAAYDVFVSDSNAIELLDTVKRIARSEQERHIESDRFSDASSAADSTMEVRDNVNILIKMLLERRLLSGDEGERLLNSSMYDERIWAAFDVYADTGNTEDFIDTMHRLARHIAIEEEVSVADSSDFMDNDSQYVNIGDDVRMELDSEENQVDDDDDDDDDSDDSDWTPGDLSDNSSSSTGDDDQDDGVNEDTEDYVSSNYDFIIRLVQSMSLSSGEAYALVDAIEEGDIAVRAALQVYKVDGDTDDLTDTLKRIARTRVEEYEEYSELDKMISDSEDVSRENAGGRRGNVDDKEQREFGSGRSLSDMLKEGMISKEEFSQFQKMISPSGDGDLVAQAAYEVYLGDGDADELVDTLRRVASRS